MRKKSEYYEQPEHEVKAVLKSAALEASGDNPETEKIRNKRKKRSQEVTITGDAAIEAMDQEEGEDKFKRILEEKPIEDAIAEGKFPNLFKKKGE